MLNTVLKLYQKFVLDFLFPIRCLGCKRIEGLFVCQTCFSKILKPEKQICFVCRKTTTDLGAVCSKCKNQTFLDGLIIATQDKSGIVKSLIHFFKYNFLKEAEHDLTKLLLSAFLQEFISNEDLVLLPVPLHLKRLKYRGFNQAEILASGISLFTNTDLDSNIIKRIKHTKPQMKLKRKERLENLKNAFEIIKTPPTGKEIILIDDVFTTGTTLEQCAKVLKLNGVKKVWALVISRGT